MSERCIRCLRPINFCLCEYTKEFDSGIKFVFLMHPKESRKQRTGTGRLARNCLKDSEILVGIDFTKNERLLSLLSDSRYFPVLMYPDDKAWNSKSLGLKDTVGTKKLLAIIVDATWSCSRKVLRLSPNLLTLPKLSFSGTYTSIFTFKREPRPECISTIESCYYIIKELQVAGIANTNADPEPLMNAFKQMIKDQLRAENERVAGLRPNTHQKDFRYTKIKEIPDF